ncbi:hypothetical protein [Halorubrum ezzemoulense]|uniref:hypothetical protein n=1 Tax=Halorubrum ezzemoulense TaxID=337243 RepID=UPI0023308DE6|nr:hypothetical protein [Halorubrum ezzemoulense]
MKRRSLLAALAGVAGVSGTVGTGAFTSVSAERQVSIQVTDDDDAYLMIDAKSEFLRATTASGPTEFYIPGLKKRADLGGPKGEGIAPNSTYTFHDLATIENRSEDPVEVYSDAPTLPSGFERLLLIDSDRQTLLNKEDNATELTPGESFSAGLLIEADDAKIIDYDLSLDIHADPVSEPSPVSPRDPPEL